MKNLKPTSCLKVKDQMFSTKTRNKTRMFLFNTMLEVLASATKQEKGEKHPDWKKK